MKQENRSSKTLKGQLLGAISMMLVAAIALGTSTYAWFINNQAVTVDPMQMEISASTSLMVALGKDGTTKNGVIEGWTGYKTKIINDDITGKTGTDVADWADMFTNPLDPASIEDSLLLAAGGATTAMTTNPTFFHSDNTVENSKLTKFTTLKLGNGAGNIGQGYVKRIPLKFLSSKAVDVYFGDTLYTLTTTSATGGTADITKMIAAGANTAALQVTAEEQASAVRAALRIAVVPHGSGTTPLTFQFDAGAPKFGSSSGSNTGYPTAEASATTIDETTGVYRGIKTLTAASDTVGSTIATTGKLTAQVPLTAGNKSVATWDSTGGKFTATDGVPLFRLAANEEREVDVYIWLDGTDQDCVSVLSQYGFKLNMPFAAVIPAPGP